MVAKSEEFPLSIGVQLVDAEEVTNFHGFPELQLPPDFTLHRRPSHWYVTPYSIAFGSLGVTPTSRRAM